MYFQNEDGSRSDLPQKNIDTGAGLERWASVLQGKRNVYETDLFAPIIAKIERVVRDRVRASDDATAGMRWRNSDGGCQGAPQQAHHRGACAGCQRSSSLTASCQ